jgi:hypothetical protein
LDNVVPAGAAAINTFSEGSTGFWSGTGSSWAGSPDLSKFMLTFDVPRENIKGIVDVISVSP